MDRRRRGPERRRPHGGDLRGGEPIDHLRRRAVALAWATIGWNVVEGVVAVTAGAVAGSGALVAFGIDSGIEVFAAVVVLWRLRGGDPDRALKLIAVSFAALALYVTVDSGLALTQQDEPDESTVGIVLAVVSLAVMPALAAAKRRVGTAMADPVVLADATETALCAWLSAILLAGLALNAAAGWWWADPIAALGIAAFALHEGKEAWEGDGD